MSKQTKGRSAGNANGLSSFQPIGAAKMIIKPISFYDAKCKKTADPDFQANGFRADGSRQYKRRKKAAEKRWAKS